MAFITLSPQLKDNSFTAVENKFITKYMPVLDAVAVKVYLYGLYLCSDTAAFTVSDLAKSLNITEEQAISCFEYLDEFDTFVAHNAAFDRSCLLQSAELYRIHLPELKWMCSLQTARRIYSFGCNRLGYLCEQLGIHEGTHHRAGDDAEMCARLYLRELDDMKKTHNSEFHGKH